MTLGSYFLKISSGNRLQDSCNPLQVLIFELKHLLTAGNRLPILYNRLHSLKFEFKYLAAVVKHFWPLAITSSGNRLPESKSLEKTLFNLNYLAKTFAISIRNSLPKILVIILML